MILTNLGTRLPKSRVQRLLLRWQSRPRKRPLLHPLKRRLLLHLPKKQRPPLLQRQRLRNRHLLRQHLLLHRHRLPRPHHPLRLHQHR